MWQAACDHELANYQQIADAARRLTTTREAEKAARIAAIQSQHHRVIAFDHHPITLAVLQPLVIAAGATAVQLATGSGTQGKKGVGKALDRDATDPAVALCSDALNEGLNLQGASAIVHLDLPTTMRAAEQRVGRIDRMDSPYDTIDSYWPRDGAAFATRAAEQLQARAHTTSQLLGANLELPDLGTPRPTPGDEIIDVDAVISELDTRGDTPWDGILDALDPVRGLITGPDALIPAATYQEHSTTRARVISRVAPVAATTPWAFFAIAGTQHGAPHWILLEAHPRRELHQLDDVVTRLRELLAENPANRAFDDHADQQLQDFVARASQMEDRLLPRRLTKALNQMTHLTGVWRKNALGHGRESEAKRWEQLANFASQTPGTSRPDPYTVGQAWFDLVKPHLADHQRTSHTRLVRLRDVTTRLEHHPLPVDMVEQAMTGIPQVPDIDTRIAACILGVPDALQPA